MLQLCVDAAHGGFTENNFETRAMGSHWYPEHKQYMWESRRSRSLLKEPVSPGSELLLPGAGSLRGGLESLRAVCLSQGKSLPGLPLNPNSNGYVM